MQKRDSNTRAKMRLWWVGGNPQLVKCHGMVGDRGSVKESSEEGWWETVTWDGSAEEGWWETVTSDSLVDARQSPGMWKRSCSLCMGGATLWNAALSLLTVKNQGQKQAPKTWEFFPH